MEQEGFELKIFFKPNSVYKTELLQITETEILIPNMPEQVSSSEVSSTSTLSVGPSTDNESDIIITYDTMDMQVTGIGAGQTKTPELAGMKIYGKLKNGIQSIDSIVGGDPTFQDMLQNLIEPMFSSMQIDFPNPMKLSDTFLDTKIIELPMGGIGITTITMNTNYTLTSVTNDTAYLTTDINLYGNLNMMGKDIPLEGTGTGTMILDLNNNYILNSSTVIDQEMKMEMQGMIMETKVKATVNTKTKKVK